MKAKVWMAAVVLPVVALLSAAGAGAAPSSTGDLTVVGQGDIFREVQRPANLSFDVRVTPEPGADFLKPLVNVKLRFPAGIDLVADPEKTEPCPISKIGPLNANFPTDTAVALCPDSLVGDGVADLFLAQVIAAPIHDGILTILNGGKDENGDTVVSIHGYSALLNQGIFITGAIRNGILDVNIPRLPVDTSVSSFQLNIPGDLGQDPAFARAACPAGHWDAVATITLAKRSDAGVESERETLDPPARSDKPCTGLAGKARFAGLKVKGPASVRSGSKGAFKVTVKNTGTASSKKGKVTASGGGTGSVGLPVVKPGASRTVKVKAKVKGIKGRKVTVKFKAAGGASATGKTTVRVG